MATLASTQLHPVTRDRRFFFIMSLVVALVVVAGFSLQFAMSRSTLTSPWWVHVHGVSFMGWLAIYVTQNWLVFRGQTLAHRKLGYIAAFYVGWLIIVGLTVNTLTAINHRIPPFFEPNVFLVMDWLTVLSFAGLTWAGVRMRGASDWHRRLMLSAAFVVMMPGIGRLTPLPLMGNWIIWGLFFCALPFWAAAMIYDRVTRGKVHRAWFWGFGTFLAMTALIRPLAFTPPMLALTKYLMG